MPSLKLTLPDAAAADQLETEVLSTVYQKLAEVNLTPSAAVSADADATVHHLKPRGSVWMEKSGNVIEVKLHSVDVDKKDLFTAVLADLEQRNDGLSGEID